MYILTVKAFADFDIPYTINVGLFYSKVAVESVKSILNNFIQQCSELNSDYKLLNIFEDFAKRKQLTELLKSSLYNGEIVELVEMLTQICREHYVYANSNIFGVEHVKVIK